MTNIVYNIELIFSIQLIFPTFFFQGLFGCNISKCTSNFDKSTFIHEKSNIEDIDEICFNLIRIYHCLLDYVSEECLINRNYVVNFNEVEGKLKDFN